MKLFSRVFALLLLVALSVSLTSCGSSDNTTHSSGSSNRDVDKSNFKGDHASDIYQLYKGTTNENAAKLLSDGDFSEQDMVDMEEMYINCMQKLGYKVHFEKNEDREDSEAVEPNGGIPQDENEASKVLEKSSLDTQKCYRETDFTNFQMLYNSIHYPHPTNEDYVNCYKSKKLVPDTYTVDDYKYELGMVDGKQHGFLQKYHEYEGKDQSKSDIDKFQACELNPKKLQ
jgi:hypothetical protein